MIPVLHPCLGICTSRFLMVRSSLAVVVGRSGVKVNCFRDHGRPARPLKSGKGYDSSGVLFLIFPILDLFTKIPLRFLFCTPGYRSISRGSVFTYGAAKLPLLLSREPGSDSPPPETHPTKSWVLGMNYTPRLDQTIHC